MDDAQFDAEALAIIRPSWADRGRYPDAAAQVAALRALADRRAGRWTDGSTGDWHDSDDYETCCCRTAVVPASEMEHVIAGAPRTCSDCPEPGRCESDGCHGMDGVELSAADLKEIG